jgi:acetyl esterase/lipase
MMREMLKNAGWLCVTACLVTPAAEMKRGVEYSRVGDAVLHLDAGVPDGAGEHPIAILIHGGGWASGDRAGDITTFCEPLTEAGFVWFSLDYRLAPSNQWPACLEDVQTAIRWVKAHGAEFKGDTNRIALVGYSAGGHLACQAAVLADDTTRVQAVVGCAAPTDHVADSERRGGLSKSLQMLLARPEELDATTRETLREMSPLNYVKPGLPPFLLLQGTADTSVPYSQSVNFLERLQRAGVPARLITLTDAPHRIRDWKNADARYQAKVIPWLQETLRPAED